MSTLTTTVQKGDTADFKGDAACSARKGIIIIEEVTPGFFIFEHPDGISAGLLGQGTSGLKYHMAPATMFHVTKKGSMIPMGAKPKVDTLIVKSAASNLIKTNSETTTLDVKNTLRQAGYQAFQNEISQIMSDLADAGELTFRNAGNHRVYTGSSTTPVATPTAGTTIPTTPITSVKTATGKSGDWEMNSTTHKDVIYVDGQVTRDEARAEYCRSVKGVKWVDTRGRKIK